MADKGDEYRRDEGDDEEDEEIDESGFKTVKDAVLFAIDVSQTMLNPAPGSQYGETATLAALKCAYALMQQRIISNPKDMMGILLFGTEQSKFHDIEMIGTGSIQYPYCYLLADLDVPAAADVKRLRSLVENESESKRLLVPSKDPVSMANVLFCANQIFTTRAPNFASRRLFLVTDNDNPHARNKDLKSAAIVRARDLFDLGVLIELFPISQPDHDFDRSQFYDDIVYRTGPTDPEAPAPISTRIDPLSGKDGIALLTSLLNSINSRSIPRRALFSNLPLELTPNLKISVKGYIIFKHQVPQKSCYIWLDGETPQIVTGTTVRTAEDRAMTTEASAGQTGPTSPRTSFTSRPVEKAQIKKAFKFGGETVTFAPEELSSIRHFGDPVIRIIGFKDRSLLPIWANHRPATFIYPSEEEFVGSTRTFSALQQILLQKNRIGIVWYIARRNAAPVIAALVPGAEKLSENREQTQPPGLWLVPLPFADDIRQYPETTGLIEAPIDLIDKMKLVIGQLQLPKATYDPSRFPNPSLQWHYRILQAMALEEDLPEKPEDKTIPRYRQIHKRAGDFVVDWGVELESQYRLWQKEHAGQHSGAKRIANISTNSPSKKAKTGDSGRVAGPDDNEVQKLFEKGQLNKLTIAQLKDFADRHSINISSRIAGKKADWVDAVEQHFERK